MAKNAAVGAMIAAALSNCIFGFSFMFSKMAMEVAAPSVLLAWRFVFALALMSLVMLTGKARVRFRGRGRELGMLVLLGVFQPMMYFVCESYGILWSTPTFSGVMIALVPIASLAFAALFVGERPTRGQIAFSLLSIAGLLMITLRETGEGTVQARGVAMLLGAIVSAVGFNIVSRRLACSFSPFERTYMMFLIGAVFFSGYALIETSNPAAILAPLSQPRFVLSVAYLGGLSSVAAFLLLNYGLTYLTVSRSTAFSNLTTVVSVLAGTLFYGDALSPLSAVASLMIIVGVWGVQKMHLRRR